MGVVLDFCFRRILEKGNFKTKCGPLGGPRVPSHGIPWAPKGSPPMGGPGPPPMGSLGLARVPSPQGPLPWNHFGLPRVPSHGIPWATKGSPPLGCPGPWRAQRGLFVKLWFYTAWLACGHPWAMCWCIFCALWDYLLDKIIYVSYNALVGILSAQSRAINVFVAASFDLKSIEDLLSIFLLGYLLKA